MWNFIGISNSVRPKRRKARKEFDRVKEDYARLNAWLMANVASVESMKITRLTFGPGARYLAWKPSGQYIANDLPKGLSVEMERRKKESEKAVLPLRVTFGLGDAWAGIWNADGSYMIELDGKYAKLKAYIEESNADTRIKVSYPRS